jgi:uncharacterized membrane protein (DUF485 family)
MIDEVLPYAGTKPDMLDQSDEVAILVGKKSRFIAVMTLLYMVSYVGLTVLAGFARDLLSAPAVGPVNLGFVLIAANYVIAWVLALVYVRVANRHFDPLVASIVARHAL